MRTLQTIGYLTPDLKIASPFRLHFAAHRGVLTPELQRVRIDLAKHAAKATPHAAPVLHPDQFWAQVARCEGMQRRIERLGYTREQVNDILTRAAAHKPTRENLNLIRANAERRAAYRANRPLPFESRAPLMPRKPNSKSCLHASRASVCAVPSRGIT